MGFITLLDAATFSRQEWNPSDICHLERSVPRCLLDDLYSVRNGCFAFAGALHILPLRTMGNEIGAIDWNLSTCWREEYGVLIDQRAFFFAEDVFGNQFGLLDNCFVFMDAETGALKHMGCSLDEWADKVMENWRSWTGFDLAHQWQERFGPIVDGNRLMPKIPFVLGGPMDLDNLASCSSIAIMRLRGHIAIQVRDVPEGGTIRINFIE